MRPLTAVLDLLAPERCLACRRRDGAPWCPPCRAEVERLRLTGTCHRCAGPPGPGHPCWRHGAPVERTIAAFRYVGPVADAVVAAKVRGAHAAWWALGEELARAVAGLTGVVAGVDVDLVTWVPAAARVRRRRGLDHAERLATVVADRLGRPCVATLVAAPHPDQASRSVAQRRRLPASAFRASDAATRPLTGHVLLIDDVLTTGATVDVAARALGARRLTVAVLARAGAHPLGADPHP